MRLFLTTAVALLVSAAPAVAEIRTLAEVHAPAPERAPTLDAFEGRVVWSDYDAAIRSWRLMEHAGGVTRALPVEPRRSPFDVDLGPDGGGGVVAVYSRCARGLRFHYPTPQNQRGARHGCDIHSFSFTTDRETAVARANTRADEYWPSVWNGRIAFVRGYPGRLDPDRTARPYLYLDGRRLRRPSPVIGGQRLSAMIEGVDLRRRTVAYAWSRIDDFESDSYIYTSTAGGRLTPAARGATSGGGAAVHVRSVSSPSLSPGRVDWLFTNDGEPDDFGAFARHGSGAVQASQRTKAVAFAHDDDVAYYVEEGLLKADDAVAYRRMPRSWQPMPPPR
jgi:hypothetical protein